MKKIIFVLTMTLATTASAFSLGSIFGRGSAPQAKSILPAGSQLTLKVDLPITLSRFYSQTQESFVLDVGCWDKTGLKKLNESCDDSAVVCTIGTNALSGFPTQPTSIPAGTVLTVASSVVKSNRGGCKGDWEGNSCTAPFYHIDFTVTTKRQDAYKQMILSCYSASETNQAVTSSQLSAVLGSSFAIK